MKVTLYRDDFTEYSWFYLLRELGIISNELSSEETHIDSDEWSEFLPEYKDMFAESTHIELEVSSFTKNF